MSTSDSLFLEYLYETLYVLSKEEKELSFNEILQKIAKMVNKPIEDLDTGHNLVNAVYELVGLELIQKSGPEMYTIETRGRNVLQIMSSLNESERSCLSDPMAIHLLTVIMTLPNTTIYRLESRITPSNKVEPTIKNLNDSGLVSIEKSPMDTHRLVELTNRGNEAFQVLGLLEIEMQRITPNKRKITF